MVIPSNAFDVAISPHITRLSQVMPHEIALAKGFYSFIYLVNVY